MEFYFLVLYIIIWSDTEEFFFFNFGSIIKFRWGLPQRGTQSPYTCWFLLIISAATTTTGFLCESMIKALVSYIIHFYSISWLPMGYKLVLLQCSYIWIWLLSFSGRIWKLLVFCHFLTRYLSIDMVEKNLFFGFL